MVSYIDRGPDDAGWLVHYEDISGGKRRPSRILGNIVVLAAGSIGSTEILLRSRDGHRTLPDLPRALGRGWSPNGDFLTLARYPDRPLNPTRGPTIGAALDFLDGVDEPDDNRDGVDGRFFVQDGGLPNLFAHLLRDWLLCTSQEPLRTHPCCLTGVKKSQVQILSVRHCQPDHAQIASELRLSSDQLLPAGRAPLGDRHGPWVCDP